jgi:hypothetical protein
MGRKLSVSGSDMNKPFRAWVYTVAVIGVFLWGAALRSPEIISRNYLFGYDQGWNYQLVRSIVDDGKQTLIGAPVSLGSGIGGLFHGPGFYYLLAIPYTLFRGNPYGSLVLVYVFGLLTMAGTYLLMRTIWGKTEALMGLFFVATSPVFISQSRFLWTPHFTPPLILACMYFLHRSYRNSAVFLPWAFFAGACIYHFHLGIAIGIVLTLIVYSIAVLKPKPAVYPFCLAAILFAGLPAIMFEVRHGFMAFRGMVAFASGIASGNGTATYSLMSHMRDYWFNYASSFDFDGILAYPIAQAALGIAVFWVSVGYGMRKNASGSRLFTLFLVMSVAVSWIFFMGVNNTIWDYYLVPLHLAYVMLASVAGSIAWNFSLGKGGVPLRLLLAIITISIATGSYRRMMRTYEVDFSDRGGTQKISGKSEAIDYIYNDAGSERFNVLTFMPPVYTYPYDYLFYWKGKNTYGYVPGSQKRGLTYLLIEPDAEKPWSYKGWLETVVKDGRVIDTTTLSTGHIIQKRRYP